MNGWVSDQAALYCEARADAIERKIGPSTIQPHTRELPSEAEVEQARFAARQLRITAQEIRAGFHLRAD